MLSVCVCIYIFRILFFSLLVYDCSFFPDVWLTSSTAVSQKKSSDVGGSSSKSLFFFSDLFPSSALLFQQNTHLLGYKSVNINMRSGGVFIYGCIYVFVV